MQLYKPLHGCLKQRIFCAKCIRKCREILSLERQKNYVVNYSEEAVGELKQKLWSKRKPKIERVDQKIELAKAQTQQVTPEFIDQLIGLYERKNTSQKDKMYILLELQKYYSSKIMQFFFKLNDTELNKQLRWIAFYHLQSFNYHPRARRQKYMQIHTKNKKRKEYLKKIYPNEKYTIPQTPMELEYRIENAKEQKIKTYDFFISHSSVDSNAVQKLILYENQTGKNVFCDWINDSDYLKRNLLCDATLKVIEKRLEQSKNLLFVDSDNSRQSIWCKYELNYFEELGKPMYIVTKEDIEKNRFIIENLVDKWYLDIDYNRMVHNYIGNIDNYSKTDKPLAFFSYIAGGFGNNIDKQLKSIVDATGVNGSAMSVSNVIKMVEQHRDTPYTHQRIRNIFSLNRQVLMRDIV